MKRRTKQNVGAWPNMRDDTLKAIADELSRARKKHPQKGLHMRLLANYAAELSDTMNAYNHGRQSAFHIYAVAAAVAAMAIRCMEEGDCECSYSGNRQDAPKFELMP